MCYVFWNRLAISVSLRIEETASSTLCCSTLMLREKCKAVFRLTTRLLESRRTSLNLGFAVARLDSVMSTQATPQPYLRRLLAMYVYQRNENAPDIAVRSDTYIFKRGWQPRSSRRCYRWRDVFKEIYRETLTQASSPHQHAAIAKVVIW
jgi:hypothetical protein